MQNYRAVFLLAFCAATPLIAQTGWDKSQFYLVKTIAGEGGFIDGITHHKGVTYVSEPFTQSIHAIDARGNVTPYLTDLPSYPFGLVFDSQDNLYVNYSYDGICVKITPEGETSVFADGFVINVGIACDAQDNIYVANFGNNWPGDGDTIYKITPAGEKSVYAQGGNLKNGPIGLAFDSQGNLFSSNYSDGDITRIAPDGSQELVTQVPKVGLYGVGYLTMVNDRLFATGFGTNQVYEINTEEGGYKVVAGCGNQGSQDGPGFLSSFTGLNGIAGDPVKGWLYVTEWMPSGDGRIRVIMNLK